MDGPLECLLSVYSECTEKNTITVFQSRNGAVVVFTPPLKTLQITVAVFVHPSLRDTEMRRITARRQQAGGNIPPHVSYDEASEQTCRGGFTAGGRSRGPTV